MSRLVNTICPFSVNHLPGKSVISVAGLRTGVEDDPTGAFYLPVLKIRALASLTLVFNTPDSSLSKKLSRFS